MSKREWPASNQGKCDEEIYKNGEVVAVLPGMPAMVCEIWIKAVRASNPGLRIDWGYFGGRNVIKCLGDVAVAKEACSQKADYMFELWDDYPLESIRSWFTN